MFLVLMNVLQWGKRELFDCVVSLWFLECLLTVVICLTFLLV